MRNIEIMISKRTHTVPNTAKWEVFSLPGETLVGTGSSVLVANTQTHRGVKLTFAVPVPENLPNGQYSLEVSVEMEGVTYSKSEDISIEDMDVYDDGTIMTFKKTFKWTSPINGILEMNYQGKIINRIKVKQGVERKLAVRIPSPSLEPVYVTVQGTNGDYITYRLYYINSNFSSAIDELKKSVDRLNMKCRLDSLKFTDGDYLDCLAQGASKFNYYGQMTKFTMEKASGPIRVFWLLCSKFYVIRQKYLEEGLTSFSYTGAAVTLDLDITQYLSDEAASIEQQLADLEKFKQQLAINGIRGGTGAYTIQNRVMAATGLSASPVTAGLRSNPNFY